MLPGIDYDIYSLGFDKLLSRVLPPLTLTLLGDLPTPSYLDSIFYAISPSQIGAGELAEKITMVAGVLRSSNYVAGVSGWQLTPTSADMNISLSVDSIHIPDENTTGNSFHTDDSGNSWWGCTHILFDADHNNAVSYILNSGVVKLQSVVLSTNVVISGLQAGSNLDGQYLQNGSIVADKISSVNASSITGSITASQIGTVNASSITGTISASQISTVNATSITGTITSSQISSVAATTITGSITSSQIGSVAATTITGSITSSQISSVNASAITGSITSSQISSVAATTITGSISSSQIGSVSATTITGVIVTAQLADYIISSLNLFASDLRPIKSVNTLPTLPDTNYPAGATVYLTTDQKLYRNAAGTWSSSAATSDLTGTLTASQIASVNSTSIVGLILAAQINSIAATQITGSITSSQISSVNASAITGTITSSQIASVAATTITGTLTASQISSVNATSISGTITAGQIASITAGQITGTISGSQIGSLTITASNIANLTISGGKIADSTITYAKISSVNADTITTGTMTGINIRTQASGQRIELTSTLMTFYDASSSQAQIYANGGQLLINGSLSTSNIFINSGASANVSFSVGSNIKSYVSSSYALVANAQIYMSGYRIISLGEPSSSSDAATKNYVDTHTGGGTLSALTIDTTKSWGSYGITGLGSITPYSSSSYNLGSTSYYWNNVYCNSIDFNYSYGYLKLNGTTYAALLYSPVGFKVYYPLGLQVRSGTPGSASSFQGYMYYDTAQADVCFSNGSNWYKLTATLFA